MISFKALPVSNIPTPHVKKYDDKRNLCDYRVAFVELNPDNMSDMKALRDIADEWDFGETFAKNIYNEARGVIRYWGEKPVKRFFALVHSCVNPMNLNSDNIIGVTEIHDKIDEVEIKYLQAEPPYTEYQMEPIFKGIGTAIINSIKALIPNKNIVLRSVDSAKKFYRKNGFVSMRKENWMIFKR